MEEIVLAFAAIVEYPYIYILDFRFFGFATLGLSSGRRQQVILDFRPRGRLPSAGPLLDFD